jgi:citrate synthase
MEQMENNILIRPLTLYNGPEPREYLAIERR